MGPSSSLAATFKSSSVTPGRILKKLRSNQAESVDEASGGSNGLSSPGSTHSKSSNRSTELSKKVNITN